MPIRVYKYTRSRRDSTPKGTAEIESQAGKQDSSQLKCSDPFTRLGSTFTKSFALKNKENQDCPKDALDIALSACYNHRNHRWAQKTESVFDRADGVKGRIFHTDFPYYQLKSCNIVRKNSTSLILPYRNDPNHVNIGITSSHLSVSRRGFGRSIDGLFYTS